MLETAGRRWATEEVTTARSISNGLTIAGFADRYVDPVRGRVAQCATRRAITQAAATRSTGVLDLMAALRSHGGSGHPAYRLANGALGAPCAHAGGLLTSTQTTASWVADVTAGQHWVTATSAPCTSIFKPVRVAPTPADEPSNTYDERFGWWRHERAHRAWVGNPTAYADVVQARDRLERRWVQEETDPQVAWAEAEEWERAAAAVRRPDDLRPPLWCRWDGQAGVWA